MYVSRHGDASPVWTSHLKLSWRQRFAMWWPFGAPHQAERAERFYGAWILLLLLVSLLAYNMQPTSPSMTDVIIALVAVVLGAALLFVPPALHGMVKYRLELMMSDPTFRFDDMCQTPRFLVAELYLGATKNSEAGCTSEDEAVVSRWLEDGWQDDQQLLARLSSAEPVEKARLQLSEWRKQLTDFRTLPLVFPGDFMTLCASEVVARRGALDREFDRLIDVQALEAERLNASVERLRKERRHLYAPLPKLPSPKRTPLGYD